MNVNTQTHIREPLLSPISPISSPETVDVLQSAERLVKSAQKQITELNFNSTLNTLDENPQSSIGQQPMDESFLYVRELVDSKFQESCDPNRFYVRKAQTVNAPSSNKKLYHDQFPVKEFNSMINKPLEISAQNSEFSTNQMAKRIFFQNEKPFFKKAPNWFNIEPPKHINVFPTSTTKNGTSKTKGSCTVPCCTMTNNGVIEINSRDHQNGTIQVQTGPTVDIRAGLTIQTIENVHISPNHSSVPIYNNIATYCFQHESSTSSCFDDHNSTAPHVDKHSTNNSSTKNVSDSRKERHIQSTDYNDTQKTADVQSIHDARGSLVKDSINPSHDTIGPSGMFTNNSNNTNELDLNSPRKRVSNESILTKGSNLHKSLIGYENVRAQKAIRESVDNVRSSSYVKKTVSISLTPDRNSIHEEDTVADREAASGIEEKDFDKNNLSNIYNKISSNLIFATSYGGKNFQHVQSDTDYKQRSHVCGDECKTGSCSRQCEKEVEYREKQKLKEALEAIANIEKLRLDTKDTGIIPTECTQICEDKNRCIADIDRGESEPFSDPEHFKTALEKLCKFSQNTNASKINTNSKMYQEAIDAFVKTFFDSNDQSNSFHGLHSSDQNVEDQYILSKQNEDCVESNQTVDEPDTKTEAEEEENAVSQVKLNMKQRRIEFRSRISTIGPSRITSPAVNKLCTVNKNTARSSISQFRTNRLPDPNKFAKLLARQSGELSEDFVAEQEKPLLKTILSKDKNKLENFELQQPSVSDVDAVLKIYRESMAAICQGTEQLSQLISHHVMKNASPTSNQISFPSIPNRTVNLEKPDVELRATDKHKILAAPISNSIPSSPKIPQQQSISIDRKNSKPESHVRRAVSNRIQATEVKPPISRQDRIAQSKDDPSILRDEAAVSNEDNSVCTNGPPKPAADEYLSSFCESSSEQVRTLSNNDEKSSPAHSNVGNDKSNSSKFHNKTLVSSKPRSIPIQDKVPTNVRSKPGGNKFMNVQYCTTEPPLGAQIPIEITTDKNKSPLQSGLESPLRTYLQLENACGKDVRLHRHSSYDIHSDESKDFNLYKCPVLISGTHSDNFDVTNNNFNDKLVTTETVVKNKEMERLTNKVYGEILDAVKNSSQFTEQYVVSLINGMEIESVNDVVTNLENAAVHPIVIEQFLVILKERNKVKSLFGGNVMLENPVAEFDNDCKENYDEATNLAKINDNMNSFKHSTGFNGSMETTNIYIDKGGEIPIELHSTGDQTTKCKDPTPLAVNSNIEIDEDCVHMTHDYNSQGNGALKDKLPSDRMQSDMVSDQRIGDTDSRDGHKKLAISGTVIDKKLCTSELLITSSVRKSEVSASEQGVEKKPDTILQKTNEGLSKLEFCRGDVKSCKDQTNVNESLRNSNSSNATSQKNDSDSKTDKDISFVIPHDAEMNNQVVDLSNVQKLTSVTLKNENTGEIIGFQIESNCRNCLRLNSLKQEKNKKINSNLDPGKSSETTNNSSGISKDFNVPTNNRASSTKDLRNDDNNIVCLCQTSKDCQDPKIGSFLIPCQSSWDKVNDRINSQVHSNFKQLGLLDSEEKNARQIPNKTHSTKERILSKRQRSTKLTPSLKSHVLKAADPNKSGVKKKKSSDKKASGNKNISHKQKRASSKGTKKADNIDSEKSDSKYVCPLCVKLEGKCSCSDCYNYITNLKAYEKTSPKPKIQREKFNKNTSSCLSESSKCVPNMSSKYSSCLIPAPPETLKNVDSKNMDSHGIGKHNETLMISARPKQTPSKLKPNVCTLSGDRNNNNKKMSLNRNLREDKKLFQDAASDSDNLKVEDKSQNTAKSGDFNVCKSIETQGKSLGALCNKITVLEETSTALPRKLDIIEEINIVDKPSVREVGTLKCFENCSSIPESAIIDHDSIARSTETKNCLTIGSQTLESYNNFQNHQPNEMRTDPEAGTVSVIKRTCPNIFDNEGIVVLQPLNELDHTYFIAKPNSAERKIIQEKLNRSFNVNVEEIIDCNCPSVQNEANKESTNCKYSNKSTSVDSMELKNSANTINCVKYKECQVDCTGDPEIENMGNLKESNAALAPTYKTDSTVRFLENVDECVDSCTNDDECLRICSQPLEQSDDLKFKCKEDCLNEEICSKLCPASSEVEPPLRTSLINNSKILKRFIKEKGLLQEYEDSLRAYQREKLGIIYEKSESHNCNTKAEIKNADKLATEAKSRCHAVEDHRRSVQYEEPDERMDSIMLNRKSFILPNVVRGIADMHPSTKLERLKLRSADPLVQGSFNKSESDRRYSVFNQPDPGSSSINLGDPKTLEHLAVISQKSRVNEQEESSSDSFRDIERKNLMKIDKKSSPAGKSNKNNASKFQKSSHGMDGDPRLSDSLNQKSSKHDNNSIKSFKSFDLEPGEFLHVRTPFDNPIKSCGSSERCDSEIDSEFSQGQAKCNRLCNYNQNQNSTNNRKGMTIQQQEYEVCLDSGEEIYTRKRNRSNINKLVCEPENVSPVANVTEQIFDGSNVEFKVQNHQSAKVEQSTHKLKKVKKSESEKSRSIRKLRFTGAKLNMLKVLEWNSSDYDNSKFSKINNDRSSNTRKDLHGIISETQNMEHLLEYSDQFLHNTKCSSRPEIIDHFLGKKKLEDVKILFTNNKADIRMSRGARSLDNNRQRLYSKSDPPSKTISKLQQSYTRENTNLSVIHDHGAKLNLISRTFDETDSANFRPSSSKRRDQTSSDTCSEGEFNFPSSCSYSLGEVKVSTPSSTITGTSFKDSDGLTIFVTKSILDSTHATCNSPGEILAEIQQTEADVSSDIS